MIDYGLFFLTGLSIYRVSFMLAKEEGPFSVFSSLRGRIDPSQSTWIGRGINCPLCISFWVCLPSALAVFGLDPYITIMTIWFPLAGLTALFERISDR